MAGTASATASARASTRAQTTAARVLYSLPTRLRRVIARTPVRLGGQELALDAQLFLRMLEIAGQQFVQSGVAESRRLMENSTPVVSGKRIEPVATTEYALPGVAGTIPATLYRPKALAQHSGLLVYYHGGGWVLGSRASHDNTARFLADHARVRVLSVEYRLAPENPFPAAVDDALRAYEYATEHADELGAHPGRIAVGGDSAGGNLAAVVAQQATLNERAPAFQLLLYPATDASRRRRSRELFADGFFLTDEQTDWFLEHYAPQGVDRTDPKLSPMLAEQLHGLPPAYITTAGFDPLRDEGEDYAKRLAEAGVSTALRRHSDLIHGFANFLGLGYRFSEALAEAAGALQVGLSRPNTPA